MKSTHYRAGEKAAKDGEFRAAPVRLKIITPPWRDWYAGFDSAVRAGKHPQLDSNFSLRTSSAIHKAVL
ncbi:MAG: hypothetical protein V3V40_06040 [Nitrosomonadaceae bacterium]